MPFRSEKQRRFMWSQHPEIAKRWSEEYGSTPQPLHDKQFGKKNGKGKSDRAN